jgi:uncharacterized protein (TIGR00730 family)
MSKGPEKAYKNLHFLNSPAARHIRIMCEYEEPRQRFLEQRVHDTIVFFGSARAMPVAVARDAVAHLERELSRTNDERAAKQLEQELEDARAKLRLAPFYDKTMELARRMTEWDMKRKGDRRYYVCTGGGPGIMEAANRGASLVDGGRSVGLGISLPFEEKVNQYVTPELGFEFHYFFTRKYWFMYLAKALVLMPGGFGTMDELFESLTLRQTGKIKKPIPTVLFGTDYWDDVLDIDALLRWGTISAKDLRLFHRSDSVDDAFEFLVDAIEGVETAERDAGKVWGR